eukprot:scpid67316/ scgid25159/ 
MARAFCPGKNEEQSRVDSATNAFQSPVHHAVTMLSVRWMISSPPGGTLSSSSSGCGDISSGDSPVSDVFFLRPRRGTDKRRATIVLLSSESIAATEQPIADQHTQSQCQMTAECHYTCSDTVTSNSKNWGTSINLYLGEVTCTVPEQNNTKETISALSHLTNGVIER